jgi:hypothetical protein
MTSTISHLFLSLTKAEALKAAGVAALLELPECEHEIANYLGDRKVRGNTSTEAQQVLAQYLNARTTWTWSTSAHTAEATIHGKTIVLVLPTHCQYFAMRWQGGMWPSLIGAPSEGTCGPVSVHQIVRAAQRGVQLANIDRRA